MPTKIENYKEAANAVRILLAQLTKIRQEPVTPRRDEKFATFRDALVLVCEEMDAFYTALTHSNVWAREEARACETEYNNLSNQVIAMRKQKVPPAASTSGPAGGGLPHQGHRGPWVINDDEVQYLGTSVAG